MDIVLYIHTSSLIWGLASSNVMQSPVCAWIAQASGSVVDKLLSLFLDEYSLQLCNGCWLWLPLMKLLTQRVPRSIRRHVGTRFFSKEVSPHPERLALLHCPHCTTILYSFRVDVPYLCHKNGTSTSLSSSSQCLSDLQKNNETREPPATVLDI